MKNVIYINCYANPWIKVAEKLQSEYGYKPVYWVGYHEDDSVNLIPQHFSNIIYQKYYDAWKGVFSSKVAQKAKECYIDVDFLRKFASEELQAIKMMDRLDIDQRSFNFMERQRHFRNLLRSWMAVFELYKPNLVVAPVMPHRVYDYALFLLCQYNQIPYVFFDHTPFLGRYIVMDNLISIGEMFKKQYHQFEGNNGKELDIQEDILNCFQKVQADYKTAIPKYMVNQVVDHKKSSGIINLARKFFTDIKEQGNSLFGNDGLIHNGVPCYYKNVDYTFENSKYPIIKYAKNKLKGNAYKKKLHAYYESLTSMPDESEKYVIFFLHYQPEATTCPAVNIFVDQQLCIDTLLKNLPVDYKVYVKEHPSQFYAQMEGHTGRRKEFYTDLSRNNRVRLISTSINSFALMNTAKAVSTGTGTVGWEAIVRQKPVIIFGYTWYENYKGVLRITDDESAIGLEKFITDYEYDEHSLKAYLAAVGNVTKRAYYYKANHKALLGISEDECIGNITNSIVSFCSK